MMTDKLSEFDKKLSVRLKHLQALFDAGGKIDTLTSFKHYAQIYFDLGYEWAMEELKETRKN